MIYEYRCGCGNSWDDVRTVAERHNPSYCKCGKEGTRIISAVPSFFRKTHPDIKQDIHELVAGEPASNFTEL